MKRLYSLAAIGAAALAYAAVAVATQPPAKTFVAILDPAQEVPACAAASNGAGGQFVAHVVDEATGTVSWKLVANNLPGDIIASLSTSGRQAPQARSCSRSVRPRATSTV